MVSSTPKDFQTLYAGEIDAYVCTVTFGQKGPKLNSSLVYCLRLFGNRFYCIRILLQIQLDILALTQILISSEKNLPIWVSVNVMHT